MISAPFAEFTWRHARRLAAEKGLDDTSETELARVLGDLLTRAQAGPADKATSRVAARTRAAAAAHRPPPRKEPTPMNSNSGGEDDGHPPAPVSPFGIFDADAEASRW
jgi:putative transposase